MDFTGERYVPSDSLKGEIEIEHLQRYHAITDIVAGKVVLDAAAGAGYGTQIVASHAAYVCGIDLSLESVLYSQKNFAAVNAQFMCANIIDLPLGNDSVDVVISFETIEHVDENIQKKFLAEIKRVLKPDGILVISSPEKSVYSDFLNYRNEYHKKEFYEDEFHKFLKQYFNNIVFADQFISLAYVLKIKDCEEIQVLNLNNEGENKAKYMLAVCSEEEIADGANLVGNLVIDTANLYQQKIQRILDLQDENTGKNKVIDQAYSIVSDHGQDIAKLNRKVNELEGFDKKKEKKIEELMSVLEEKKASLGGMSKLILETGNKLMLEQERSEGLSRELLHIYSTKAWRIIQKLYLIKNKIWPF